MFGFPLSQSRKFVAPSEEDETDTRSSRSSPSISEYLSSSSEDMEDVDAEFTPSIFGGGSFSRREEETDVLASPFSTISETGIMAAALSNNLRRYEASSSSCSSFYTSAVKDRSSTSTTPTCSSEAAQPYGTGNYAVQMPVAIDSGMSMDDEEYWWMNV